MLGIFGKSAPAAPWLGSDERLFTLKLTKVENPLDPSPLWDSRYGGGKQITETVRNSTVLRLRDALDMHRATILGRDSRGWQTEERKVFTDVVIWIPRPVWNRDIQQPWQKSEMLCDNLSRLHYEDFGDHLLNNRKPSYAVMPLDMDTDMDMEEDQVMMQFGWGVFIPGEEDRPVGKISVKLREKSQWQSLPDWIFRKNGKGITRASALYEHQQFLLIGADPESAALQVLESEGGRKIWFSHGQGSIWFNLGDEKGKYGFGCEGYVGQGRPLRDSGDGREMVFPDDSPTSSENAQAPELLYLKIEALTGEEAENAPEIPIPDADFLRNFQKGRTIIPGMIRHQLVLQGIALPRPDYVPGLESWTLRMDEKGYPAHPQESAKDSELLLFFSDFRENRIYFRKPGEKDFLPAKELPFPLPDIRGLSYQMIPSPLPEQYLAILLLPEPRFIPMDEEGFLIGRSVAEPGLRLDYLLHPQSLKWQPGWEAERSDTTLGHIGISGEHARVALRGDQLLVQMDKGSTDFYILDREQNVKHTFRPFQKTEIFAKPDDCLLLGPYLLRFV